MARYLNYGQTAIRPDSYFNYDKASDTGNAGSSDGITAVLFRADWGPLNTPVTRTADEGYSDIFGDGDTTDAIALAFEGGTQTAVLVRVGTGGTQAKTILKTSGTSGADAVTITAKYVGSKAFTATIRDSISDDTKRELVIYSGTYEFEKVSFTKGSTEGSALVAAMASSDDFTAVLTGTDGELATVAQQAFTAGTDPTASATEYSAGLTVLEQENMNCIAVDTGDWAIIALVSAFCKRMFNAGTNVIGCVAEPSSVDIDTRKTHAASLNSELMTYVVDPKVEHAVYGDSNGYIDGYQTAAKVAGMIAGTSASKSLTHTVLTNVTGLGETMTDAEITDAETKGCIVLTKNKSGQVWIDSAITTLVTPDSNQDSGWKKIRRTKTRLELLTRCNNTVDTMVGKVDNDNAGRKAIIDAIGGICDQMIGENKITWYNVYEDPTHAASGDSCWFIIDVIDKDSAEHVYLRYLFRFDTNAPASTQ